MAASSDEVGEAGEAGEAGSGHDEAHKLAVNRAHWDERVPAHVASDLYDVDGFIAGRNSLEEFERAELGSVDGLDLVHLQCHFGLDTLSWARLGARVTGLDFSGPAIDEATRLAAEVGIEADFVAADVYGAVDALGGRTFDVVYTGLGALLWLPDLVRWAGVVDALLRPGGTFYLAEFHPLVQMMADDDLTITHGYFGLHDGLRWDDPGTYADPDLVTDHDESWEWTHPVSSVVTALLDRDLVLESFREHPFTLWPRWPFLVEHEDRTWWMPDDGPKLPLIYSIRMTKPG